jgi:hypothetical protein
MQLSGEGAALLVLAEDVLLETHAGVIVLAEELGAALGRLDVDVDADRR